MVIIRHLLPLIILCIGATTCVRIGSQRGPVERAAVDRLQPPPLSGLPPKLINFAMLGHRGLYDDFVAIWTVQTLADKDIKSYATKEQVQTFINAVIRTQPKIESLYLLSCFVMALDYDIPQACESIGIAGLKAFPHSWRIPMMIGFVYSFKLGDQAKAAGFYGIASTRPQSPTWVASLARTLAERGQNQGQDLNATIDMLREIPGGTRLLQILKPKFRNTLPADIKEPNHEPAGTDFGTEGRP